MGNPELLDNLQREKYQVTSTSLDMDVEYYMSPFKLFLFYFPLQLVRNFF